MNRRKEKKSEGYHSETSDQESRSDKPRKKKGNGDTAPKVVTARIVKIEHAGMNTAEDREHLLEASSDEPVTVVDAQQMVEVMAPAALAEGYQFPVTVANRTFMVTVPKGGCQERQTFSVPLPREEDCIHPRVQVPVGHWKDGFWDLFQYGYCHVTVLNSCCCVPIAMGQVISRLQLTWKGRPTNSIHEATGSFKYLLYIVCVYWLVRATMLVIIANLDPNAKFDGSHPDHSNYEEPPNSYYFCCALDDLFWYSYFAFSVYLLRNVRVHVRSKYAIPESGHCPKGCEDLCCSLVCPCFTAAQILRHTTDYDTYDARCCTDTGLPAHAPAIV